MAKLLICLLPALILFTGCIRERERVGPLEAVRTDLSAISGSSDPAVGVALDAAGDRFVLTRAGLLYRLDGDGFELIWQSGQALSFTDLSWVRAEEFVVAAETGTYLLDVATGQRTVAVEHAEPVVEPSDPPEFRYASDVLTVGEGVLYRHTRTMDQWDSTLSAAFESRQLSSGAELGTVDAPWSVRDVTGMAHFRPEDDPGRDCLAAAVGDELFIVDLWINPGRATIEELGFVGTDTVVQIQSLAVHDDTIYFVDGFSHELRSLPLSRLVERARQQAVQDVPDDVPLGT